MVNVTIAFQSPAQKMAGKRALEREIKTEMETI